MASTYIDSSLLSVFMTSTGYVALCSNQLGLAEEARLFGTKGMCPPRAISDLVKDMLSESQSAPQVSDADDLRHLETELKQSLSHIQDALKRV